MPVVLITGCGSGVGKLAAIAFVFASMRDTSRAQALRDVATAAAVCFCD